MPPLLGKLHPRPLAVIVAEIRRAVAVPARHTPSSL